MKPPPLLRCWGRDGGYDPPDPGPSVEDMLTWTKDSGLPCKSQSQKQVALCCCGLNSSVRTGGHRQPPPLVI